MARSDEALTFEKIYSEWNKIQERDRNHLRMSLEALKRRYEVLRRLNDAYYGIDRPTNESRILYESELDELIFFLASVKNISETWYYNLTEGEDIVNLYTKLHLEGKEQVEAGKILLKRINWVVYISHAMLRVYDEPNVERKKKLLRALFI